MTEPKSNRGGTREGAGRPKVLADDTVQVGLQLRKKTNARLGKAAKKHGKTKSELAEEILSAALQTESFCLNRSGCLTACCFMERDEGPYGRRRQ